MENVIMPCDRISKNIPYIIIFILNWIVREGGLLKNRKVKTSMALSKYSARHSIAKMFLRLNSTAVWGQPLVTLHGQDGRNIISTLWRHKCLFYKVCIYSTVVMHSILLLFHDLKITSASDHPLCLKIQRRQIVTSTLLCAFLQLFLFYLTSPHDCDTTQDEP